MKILLSEGMTFQDLVVQILSYAEHDFIPIKAWGNIGDRKNDGCIPSKGVYYQIYAPENLNNTYIKLLRKIRNDFTGLLEHYKLSAVKKYYFIVNDKYAGVHPDSFGVIEELKNENNLEDANILCAKDLENILFALGDDEIYEVVGAFPDPSAIQLMDYSILTEVLQHIMQQSIKPSAVANYVVPDWDEKIKFNNLTEGAKHLLNGAMIHVGSLDEYLKNNSDFVAEALRDH